MALPVSPNAISLGQVNTELGISPSTTEISLNQAAVRTLFAISSGAIAMSDGHGKSAYTPYLNTATFATAGTWTVPAQVTSIQVKAWGGGGAASAWHAGGGGFISGYLSVTPGSTLTISAIGAGGTYTIDETAACSGGLKVWASGGGGTAVYYTNSIYMIAGGGGGSYGGQLYGPGYGGGGGGNGNGHAGNPYDMQSAPGTAWGTNTHGRGGNGSNTTPALGGAAPPSILVQGYGGVVTQFGLGGAGQSHVYNQFGFVAAGGLPRTTSVCMGPYGYAGVEYVGCGGGGGWAGGGGAGWGGAGGGGGGATSTWTSVTGESSPYAGAVGGQNDANWTIPTAGGGIGNSFQNSHPAGFAGKVVIRY